MPLKMRDLQAMVRPFMEVLPLETFSRYEQLIMARAMKAAWINSGINVLAEDL